MEDRQTWTGSILITLIMSISMAGSMASSGGGPSATVISYALDMEPVRREFRENGSLSLQVPHLGEVAIRGWEIRASEVAPLVSIPIHGYVEGQEGESAVDLLLGTWGVYGLIEVSGLLFEFAPVQVAGTFHDLDNWTGIVFNQTVSLTEPDSKVLLPQTTSTTTLTWPCAPIQSYVQVDVDPSVWSARVDWSDRAYKAFTGHHGSVEMWKDLCIELLMKGGGPRAVSGVGTRTYIHHALNDYTSFLAANSYQKTTDASSYGLWTERDLYKCPESYGQANCPESERTNSVVGAAWSDKAVFAPSYLNRNKQVGAVSVVEDRGRSDSDRAEMSGHELSHSYGEQNHRSSCKAWDKCNIMRATHDWKVRTYWVDASRCEVNRWYFYGDTSYQAGEECPNWFDP